jgi:hypothetical protein
MKNILWIAFAVLLMSACTKEYYFDSGVHNGKFEGSALDYLKTKPEYFDTLVRVIDLAEMNDVFTNDEITFFAPPNGSISKAVQALNRYLLRDGKDTISDLKQIKKDVWKEMLSLYVFKGKYTLKDIPQLDTVDIEAYAGQSYESLGGRPMVLGVIYNNAGGVKYAGYRQLYISYITDFGNPKRSRVNIPIASSNIEPKNSILHVLAFRYHTLGFSTDNFILKATSKGIDPADL